MAMTEFIEVSHSLRSKSQSDLQVLNIGFEDCPHGYGYGPRVRPYHLIHFVRKGCGVLQIADMDFPVKAGEAFLIPAERISYYEADAEDPWGYSWIGFLGRMSDQYMMRLMHCTHDRFVLRGLNTEKYASLIAEGAALQDATPSNYFQANAVLYRIFAALFADLEVSLQSGLPMTLADDIRLFLDMKYSEKLQLQDVADAFHIHPNYLTRIFNEAFGTGPKQYLISRKLEKACQLLRETDMPVATIAASVGIEDPLSFSRVFRRKIGTSPSAYRENR